MQGARSWQIRRGRWRLECRPPLPRVPSSLARLYLLLSTWFWDLTLSIRPLIFSSKCLCKGALCRVCVGPALPAPANSGLPGPPFLVLWSPALPLPLGPGLRRAALEGTGSWGLRHGWAGLQSGVLWLLENKPRSVCRAAEASC